ncbi:MAG: hypothetical protein NPIRA04_04010 [Nitrospirales bacterium]|nr:MAG: hypothetical protein NPIRA04_04010 [Nitrospirales bacterium]
MDSQSGDLLTHIYNGLTDLGLLHSNQESPDDPPEIHLAHLILVTIHSHPGQSIPECLLTKLVRVTPELFNLAHRLLLHQNEVRIEQPSSGERTVHLTEHGLIHAQALEKPSDWLFRQIHQLDHSLQEALYQALVATIRQKQQTGEIVIDQLCRFCTHFTPFLFPTSRNPHYCAYVGAPFGDGTSVDN